MKETDQHAGSAARRTERIVVRAAWAAVQTDLDQRYCLIDSTQTARPVLTGSRTAVRIDALQHDWRLGRTPCGMTTVVLSC